MSEHPDMVAIILFVLGFLVGTYAVDYLIGILRG